MKLSCWKNLMTENFNARVLGTQKCFSPSLAASPWNTMVLYCTGVLSWMWLIVVLYSC